MIEPSSASISKTFMLLADPVESILKIPTLIEYLSLLRPNLKQKSQTDDEENDEIKDQKPIQNYEFRYLFIDNTFREIIGEQNCSLNLLYKNLKQIRPDYENCFIQ